MRRPWRKRWPYVSRSGRKSYQVGFRDHDGVERTKSFPCARLANDWTKEFVAAERRGNESLRRFLLDLDAMEANELASNRTVGEVLQLYFAFNAPDTADGLASSTFKTYRHSASRHLLGLPGMSRGKKLAAAPHGVRFARQPASAFNRPAGPRALREDMRIANVGPSARAHAWRVLSAALSWAAASALVPEIESNGCLLANERTRNRRKSMRGTGARATSRRRGKEVDGWALSPLAVELVCAQMRPGSGRRIEPILADRDAMIVRLQFGLALRNQEVYGLRWASVLDGPRAHITEVLSCDKLDGCAKTERATGRSTIVPPLLAEDLCRWRALLRMQEVSARECDFVIPREVAARGAGRSGSAADTAHMTANQAQKWGPRYLRPAAQAVAKLDPRFAQVATATPYSLRRGGISARLRGEDAQTVADQCGTSLEMLSQHYSFDIADRFDNGPQSLNEQWSIARARAKSIRAECEKSST